MTRVVCTYALVAVATLVVEGQEWRESTLYVTRLGPAEPAVEAREGLRREEGPATGARGERSDGKRAKGRKGLEPGIARTESGGVVVQRRERAEEREVRQVENKEQAGTVVLRDTVRRTKEEKVTPGTPSPALVDKFVDANNDGYDDRAQCEDL